MAKTINSTVGKAYSTNSHMDVLIVQELLNNVPESDGGTKEEIIRDGKCGPDLIELIANFQENQFPTPFEHGKVSPGGQTIKRLNDYCGRPSLTGSSEMLCPHGGKITARAAWSVHGLDRTEWPLKPTDHCTISGCPISTPCVKVQWMPGPYKGMLDADSTGMCLSKMNAPQGTVVIANA